MAGSRVVGPYRLEGLIGRGGAGDVYAAVHERIGQRVAVKLLSPEVAADPKARARFLDEARILATLDHPGIVRILGCDERNDGAGVYVAMELLEGASLRDRLRGARLVAEEAIEIGCQIAEAMAEVHARGVIHRDLKPENVVLAGNPEDDRAPRVKIIDFGIAKAPSSRGETGLDTRVDTGGAAWLGTVAYMAPEQCRDAASIGPAADVYSLGIVLFEMLSGARPFDAKDAVGVAAMHLSIPAPAIADKNVAPGVRALVGAMLEKDPGRRPTMAEVRAALRRPEATRAHTPSPSLTPWSGRPAIPMLLGSIAVGFVLIAGLYALDLERRERRGIHALLDNVDHFISDVDWTLAQKPHTLSERQATLAHFHSQLDTLPERQWPDVLLRRIQLAHRIGDVALVWGTLREADDAFGAARRLIDELAIATAETPDVLRLRALNASKRGKVALARHELPSAQRAFAEAIEKLAALDAASTQDSDLRRTLAISEQEHATLLIEQGDARGALPHLQKSVARLAENAGDYDAKEHAEALVLLGETAGLAGDREAARAAFMRAIAELGPLLRASPADTGSRLARARADLGIALLDGSGQESERLRMEAAIARLRTLVEEDPGNKRFALALGKALEAGVAFMTAREDAARAAQLRDLCRAHLLPFLQRDMDDVRFRRLACAMPDEFSNGAR